MRLGVKPPVTEGGAWGDKFTGCIVSSWFWRQSWPARKGHLTTLITACIRENAGRDCFERQYAIGNKQETSTLVLASF
jgi:hypothetical protein